MELLGLNVGEGATTLHHDGFTKQESDATVLATRENHACVSRRVFEVQDVPNVC